MYFDMHPADSAAVSKTPVKVWQMQYHFLQNMHQSELEFQARCRGHINGVSMFACSFLLSAKIVQNLAHEAAFDLLKN